MKKTFFRKLILFKITLSWLAVISGSAESTNLSDMQLINMARDEGRIFNAACLSAGNGRSTKL